MSRRASRGRHVEEETDNHERWLLTYADMITLLMVLFIVMFAISQVDQKRFIALKEGLASGFGQSVSILDGSKDILDEPGTEPVPPVAAVDFATRPGDISESGQAQPAQPATAAADRAAQDRHRRQAAADAETDRLKDVRRRLHAALARHGLADDVRMTLDGRGLTVSLVSRHVVFAANLPTLTPRGKEVVDVLAPVLRELPDELEIDGHTNQVPVHPKYFPTDWDLSAARAVTVLRRLDEHGELPGKRLKAVAFGHEKPLRDPSEPGSQWLNKRVDIVVLSGLPEQTRRLLGREAAVVKSAGRSAGREGPS